MRTRIVSILAILVPTERGLDPDRRAFATSLDDCVTAIRRPPADWLAGVDRDVLAACEASAVPLATLLRNRRVDLGPDVLARLRGFIRDRERSPLFGHDATTAGAALHAILVAARRRRRAEARGTTLSARRAPAGRAAVPVGKLPATPR